MCVFLLSSFLCSFSRSVSLVCSCIRLQKRRKAIVHPLAIHMRWYKARLKPGQRCFPVFLHSAMDLLSSLFQHWFVVFMMLLPLLLLCANILCHAFPSTRLHVAGYFLFSSHFLGCLFCRFLFLVVFLSFIYSRVHVLKSMCFSSEFRRFSFDVDFCNILSSRFVFSHWLRVCLCVCVRVCPMPFHAMPTSNAVLCVRQLRTACYVMCIIRERFSFRFSLLLLLLLLLLISLVGVFFFAVFRLSFSYGYFLHLTSRTEWKCSSLRFACFAPLYSLSSVLVHTHCTPLTRTLSLSFIFTSHFLLALRITAITLSQRCIYPFPSQFAVAAP